MDEIQTFSMFSNKKIIHVDAIKDKHSSIIENMQDVEFENVILIQDINFPFFVASLIYFLVIISIIKNYDILNLNKK